MNPTYKALIARGISSDIANKIIDKKHTLKSLSALSANELLEFGINYILKNQIFDSNRPPIPDNIIDNLFYKSKRTCCICRDSNRSIVIHHIKEWCKSKSNEENNLVVLCVQHHDEAHTKKEHSQNLTPQNIISAKQKWEDEVKKADDIIKIENSLSITHFKELNVTTKRNSELKKQWYQFLKKIGMRVEIIEDTILNKKFDFEIFGKTSLYVKVFDIKNIDELVNAENLIQEFKETSFLDSLIVLGAKPFLSNDGYYCNEINIQIGWIYSYGNESWDNVMLKSNYDISNSKFFIEDLLYEHTNYKDFLTDSDYDDIMLKWNEK